MENAQTLLAKLYAFDHSVPPSPETVPNVNRILDFSQKLPDRQIPDPSNSVPRQSQGEALGGAGGAGRRVGVDGFGPIFAFKIGGGGVGSVSILTSFLALPKVVFQRT